MLAVLPAAQFLTDMDLWVGNIALPTLQHEFAPASLPDVSWILDVYAIVLAALLLPAGRAADSIGRRRCFLAGLVVFGAASLGCALAPALWALMGAAGLGLGGARHGPPARVGGDDRGRRARCRCPAANPARCPVRRRAAVRRRCRTSRR